MQAFDGLICAEPVVPTCHWSCQLGKTLANCRGRYDSIGGRSFEFPGDSGTPRFVIIDFYLGGVDCADFPIAPTTPVRRAVLQLKWKDI
jgi:hypothetical protein